MEHTPNDSQYLDAQCKVLRWHEMGRLPWVPAHIESLQVHQIKRRNHHEGFSTHFQIEVRTSLSSETQVVWVNADELPHFFNSEEVALIAGQEITVLYGPDLPAVEPELPLWRRHCEALKAGRFVVAAACRLDKVILVGVRHFDPVMATQLDAIREDRIIEAERLGKAEQGFIDQFGIFMNRKEAYQVALRAGQLNNRRSQSSDGDTLFSEDLY